MLLLQGSTAVYVDNNSMDNVGAYGCLANWYVTMPCKCKVRHGHKEWHIGVGTPSGRMAFRPPP